MSMWTWVAALSKRFTERKMSSRPVIQDRIVGRVIISDEAEIPDARAELIRRSFEAAGRPQDSDFLYDFYYNEELELFELVVMIDVDGGRDGDSKTP